MASARHARTIVSTETVSPRAPKALGTYALEALCASFGRVDRPRAAGMQAVFACRPYAGLMLRDGGRPYGSGCLYGAGQA